jgi:hypothetical protein
MRKNISKLIILIHIIAAPLAVAQIQPIKVGSSPNMEDGDTRKASWDKQNANNQFLLSNSGGGPTNGQSASQVTNISSFVANNMSNALPVGISLKAFGAVGDGVTDDTTALQTWANIICASNAAVGIMPPASGGYYKISSPITFSNTCFISALGGGSSYPASDFGMTRCLVAQATRGLDCFDFTSYADSIRIDGIGVTNLAVNNFSNLNSCGFKFTGTVGSHMSRITQCSAANFGRGCYSVDLAAVTFDSCGFSYNGIGIELTNTINGNYPLKVDSCVLAFNYTNQLVCLSQITPLLVENCILTPDDASAHTLSSFSPATTLLNCRIQPITTNNLIEVTGGIANIIGTTIQFDGTYGGFTVYPITATNCTVNLFSSMTISNAANGASIYLSGTSSKLNAFPLTWVVTDDGSGNKATNLLGVTSLTGKFIGDGGSLSNVTATVPDPLSLNTIHAVNLLATNLTGNGFGLTNVPFTSGSFAVLSNAFTNVICGYLKMTNGDGRVFTIGVGTNM